MFERLHDDASLLYLRVIVHSYSAEGYQRLQMGILFEVSKVVWVR